MERRDGGEKREDKREGKGKEKEEEGEREVLVRSRVRCKGELSSLAPKRGGPSETATSTPVLPWKDGGGVAVVGAGGARQPEEAIVKPTPFSSLFLPPPPPPVPVRSVAAAVWEFLQYFSPPGSMQFGGEGSSYRIRLHQHHPRRRHDHRYHHQRHQQGKGDVGFDDRLDLGGPSHASPEHQPATASSLRRQVAALLAQHHRSSERNHRPPQPLSPASYESSLEINPYNQASTPSSSIELKGRIGESSHGFKTSTELLKVLNRIWTLEERHASNTSLVKALKTELDHARARIKELLRDQQASRHEIDELMKEVAEDKLARKSKEHERINSTIRSLRDELEDERRLRKRSESLHRRLAKEIFEVKVGISTSLKELERERSGRCLLEEVCDEFAKGIIDYERQKTDKNRAGTALGMTEGGRLIVHMSESWLDERMQMKDQEEEQGSVVDKLRHEIESFLQAQKMVTDSEDAKCFRRNSLESFPLNEAGSAPPYTGNEDSAASNLFEIKPMGNSKLDTPEDSETKPVVEEKPVAEISTLQASDGAVGSSREGKGAMDKLMSELLVSEGGGGIVDPGERKATIAGPASPDLEILESTSKNTLKARLQEPKTKVGYRSRLKILKGSS